MSDAAADPVFALLSSPMVGPVVWLPVSECLRDQGHDVVVVPRPDGAPSGPVDVLDHTLTSLPDERPLVVVAHSNAGAYAPGVADICANVAGLVFVDAILPPSAGEVPLSSPAMLAHLEELAIDGVLPVWTDWFDESDVAALFPDDVTRQAVCAQQHRLPLAYFAQAIAVPPNWDHGPSAYMAFGSTYAAETADALQRGWPVRTLPGDHLHMLVAPTVVASAIVSLVDQMLP